MFSITIRQLTLAILCAPVLALQTACFTQTNYGPPDLTSNLLEATNLMLTVDRGQTITGVLPTKDSQGQKLTFSITSNPTKGTTYITNYDTGEFTYTANGRVAGGCDVFNYRVTNGKKTVEGSVKIAIFNVSQWVAPQTVPVPSPGAVNPSPTPAPDLLPEAAELLTRYGHSATWNGSEMMIWGGRNSTAHYLDGGVFSRSLLRYFDLPYFQPGSIVGPAARAFHSAIWTGSELIIWGGSQDREYLGNGQIYRNGEWVEMSLVNAPSPRAHHGALWTGSEMMIWGGTNSIDPSGDGALYNPATNTWRPISSVGAPLARASHSMVKIANKVVVWGGYSSNRTPLSPLFDGAIYDLATDTWSPMSATNAPAPRFSHRTVVAEDKMIVWGGQGENNLFSLDTGGIYDVSTNTWSPMSMQSAPSKRGRHTMVWTGNEVIVFGGRIVNDNGSVTAYNDGALYQPACDVWKPLPSAGAPNPRYDHTAIWTGSEMLVWGGQVDVAEAHPLSILR